MKSKLRPQEIAETLLDILGTQEKVAEILGVSQPNVSKYLNDQGAEAADTVLALGARLLADYRVRLIWIEAFLADRIIDGRLDLIRKEELVSYEGQLDGGPAKRSTNVVEREIETFGECQTGNVDLAAVVAEAAVFITSEYLAWGFLSSGDFFGFYVEDGTDLRVVSFTLNGESRPRSSITGSPDPIFGG